VRRYATLFQAVIVVVGSSCADDPIAPEPIKSVLSCTEPNGRRIQCDLLLEQIGGFTLTLTSRECLAHGNTLTLTKPTVQVLSSDACTLPPGTTWSFPGPYPVGTAVSLEILSPKLNHDPGLLADGEYPAWTLTFEDGFDEDFDDLILALHAEPSAP
jgi:hypothetical protein